MVKLATTRDSGRTFDDAVNEKVADDDVALSAEPIIPLPVKHPWRYKGPALAMVLLLNCACYWFSASLGPLKTTLKKELIINNAQYGVITSSGNLVNTVVPLISGVIIDYYGPEWLSLGSSGLILLGAVISGIGASTRNYGAVVSGEVIVGLGSITVETAQLKIYTHWAHGSHLGTIYGLNNAVNRVIVVVAKATAIPIVNGAGWQWVIWVPAFISGFVMVINCAYVVFERRIPESERALTGRRAAKLCGRGGFNQELSKSWAVVTSLPAVFWLFTLTQLLQNATVQTYVSLQADMITTTRGAGLLSAGYISAVGQVPVIILAPLTGLFMDRFGFRMHFVPVSAAFFILIFALTGFSSANAVALAIVLGVGLAINLLPFTISMPLLVPTLAHIGTAQGTYQAFINGGHVIMVTAAGAIQDRTPTGKHSYDNVFYFLMAIKALDVVLGLFYVGLDRVSLDSILTRSERAQAEHNLAVLAGEKLENVASLRRPSRAWTWIGLSTGAAMTIAAWVVYLVYAQGS